MKTLIFIHGGESFTTQEEYLTWIQTTAVDWNSSPFEIKEEKKRWKMEIAKAAITQGDRVYLPDFPNPQNAKYQDWKLFFEAWIQTIERSNGMTFIGTSLGGCFLLKYFSENPNPQWKENISQIHLVATCIESGDFTPPINYKFLQFLGNRVHIWHAEDDSVVPFETAEQLSKLLPEAQTHFFSSEK